MSGLSQKDFIVQQLVKLDKHEENYDGTVESLPENLRQIHAMIKQQHNFSKESKQDLKKIFEQMTNEIIADEICANINGIMMTIRFCNNKFSCLEQITNYNRFWYTGDDI